MATESATAPPAHTAAGSHEESTRSAAAANDAKTAGLIPTGELPSAETRRRAEARTVLDHAGNAHTFKSLYDGPESTSRGLVVFIRHFFCGNCQEYLRALSGATQSGLPADTSIVVVGCGDPALIDFYATESECAFPIYADPSRKLYEDLDLVTSMAMGERPAYLQKSMARLVGGSIMQGLKHLTSGLATKGGDSLQNGGEFLFERSAEGEKEVTWCHRMTNTRDHAGIPELMQILGQGETGSNHRQ